MREEITSRKSNIVVYYVIQGHCPLVLYAYELGSFLKVGDFVMKMHYIIQNILHGKIRNIISHMY